MDAQSIVEWVNKFGWEYFKYYPSVYRAIVVRVDDPEERGRIQLRSPAVGHVEAPEVWVPPAFDGAGTSRGSFWPPEVGDAVYVTFQQGNAGRPQCYFGGWYGTRDSEADLPSEFAYTDGRPETRGFVTRGGHRLIFKDTADGELVELAWHKPASGDASREQPAEDRRLSDPDSGAASADRGGGDTSVLRFLADGGIELVDAKSQRVHLKGDGTIYVEDANGNTMTLDDNGVTIDAALIKFGADASSRGMKFEEWKQWAENHKHLTAWGLSDKPIQPPPDNIASEIVKLE